jgi:SPP1 gp7 family putative phage head morphogenesis protein
MPINFSFNLPPEKNMEYLLQKKPELHYSYSDIMFEAHHKAFTVAKITKADLLLDIQTSLIEAQKKGFGFEKWKKEIKPTLQKKGWWGTRQSVNPETGEMKEIKIGSTRLKTIYDTNMKAAYGQARAQTQYEPESDAVYLRYVSALEKHSRPKHKSAHGWVLHRDNDWWARNYAPLNGYNCRCKVFAYTKKQVEAKGWSIIETVPQDIADKGFAYDKRNYANDKELESILKQKVSRIVETNDPKKLIRSYLNENLAKIMEERKKWNDFKKFFKIPAGSFEIATLAPKIKSMLKAKTDTILLSEQTIKSHGHHPEIGAFDYYLINYMQKNTLFAVQKEDGVKVILIKKFSKIYEVILKATQDKKEVYLITMFVIKNLEREKKKLIKQGGEEIKI